MAEERKKPLRGKVVVTGRIECVTGLHVGAPRGSLDIGGLDAPVLRDPLTREPYLPGSSLKGKLRSLFERRQGMTYNRHSGQGVYRHECAESACRVCRLFGATGGRDGENLPARLIVRDALLTAESKERLENIDTGLQYTELKFENALDRITAAANPRQIERVPAGTQFHFEMVYNVEAPRLEETEEDLVHVLQAMSLLEDDYVGGHGSRGYGKIRFNLDELLGKKAEFYGAATDAERDQTSARFSVSTVSACKEKILETLLLFS